jgi:hypothetical protein
MYVLFFTQRAATDPNHSRKVVAVACVSGGQKVAQLELAPECRFICFRGVAWCTIIEVVLEGILTEIPDGPGNVMCILRDSICPTKDLS